METNNLNQKFAKILNEVPNFSTDETANAGNRTYKYLNLSTLLKSIKPIFERNRLSFTQKVTLNNPGDGRQTIGTVETIIFDDTDQMTVCEYPFFVTGDPQQVGSAITYARRYSLTTVLGIFLVPVFFVVVLQLFRVKPAGHAKETAAPAPAAH